MHPSPLLFVGLLHRGKLNDAAVRQAATTMTSVKRFTLGLMRIYRAVFSSWLSEPSPAVDFGRLLLIPPRASSGSGEGSVATGEGEAVQRNEGHPRETGGLQTRPVEVAGLFQHAASWRRSTKTQTPPPLRFDLP